MHFCGMHLGWADNLGRSLASRGLDAVFWKHELGMIARHRRLVELGRAVSVDTGQKHRRLELGRCHRRIVGDSLQVLATALRYRQRLSTSR